MKRYRCKVCGYIHDEAADGLFSELPDDWVCPRCASPKSVFELIEDNTENEKSEKTPVKKPHTARGHVKAEPLMLEIHEMATTGRSITEPMRTLKPTIGFDEVLIKGAQLATIPVNNDEEVSTRTVIGPNAKFPLVLDTPILITHMSFGALSKEAKIALAKGSAAVGTAIGSGEGGMLEEEFESARKYIFEYATTRYGASEENMRRADAVEIKIGQAAKPGLGGELLADKVTEDIARVRGVEPHTDLKGLASYDDIRSPKELKEKVSWIRAVTGGKPVGIKLAAGNIETDLEVALFAGADFITLDSRPGGTGAAPKYIKDSTSVPTLFALYRARKFLDERGVDGVSLIITGGLRISSDFAKALALGADAVAIGTSALMAIGCHQSRICHTGLCPSGITTHDPELRKRIDIEKSATRLENFLRISTEELKSFARLTGNRDVHGLTIKDLATTHSEISDHTGVEHV